jgi:alpha-glucosidase (family GH31 glycosyl hydrolase)
MFADENRTGFYFFGNTLTYDILYGPSYADMMQRYTQIAGGSLMPPLWAFDSIWWRDDHHADLRGGASNAQDVVIHDADRLRSLKIPASAIWLDRPYGTGDRGWGNMDFDSSFPSPKKMVSDLHDRGMYLLVWVANRLLNNAYENGLKKGYMFDGPFSAADIGRPEVYNWLKAEFDKLVSFGVRGYKIDRGEEGEMPRSVENEFAILLPKLAAEGLKKAYGDDFFDFSRNANDTARKYTAIWNGDTQPTFGGLQVSVKNAQRSGAINFPMWGSDTGGYLGVPDKELFARWLEFSAFSPIMEVLNGPKRTIWFDYDDQLVEIAQRYTRDHHDLIPYTRSEMYQATQTGMPIVRSLVFEYPSDSKLADMWDEYMFGDSLLVAPLVNAGETSRSVYLPAGNWLDYNDCSTLHRGGSSVTVNAPLDTIPLFVREGAIIPRGDILKSNNNWDANWKPNLRVQIFPAAATASQFQYYTGSAVRPITATPGSGGVEVALEDMGTPGKLEIYWSGANRVTRDGQELRSGSGYSYDASAHKLTIPFTGAATIRVEGGQSLFANAAAASMQRARGVTTTVN